MMNDVKPTAPRRYSPETKERAVRMVLQLRKETGEKHGSVKRVAAQLDVGVESLRSWVKQAEVDAGERPGTTTAEAARISEWSRSWSWWRANAILRSASAFFGGNRPPIQVMVDHIDQHRDEFGVEPICRAADGSEHVYAAKKRELAPSARAVRDVVMMQVLMVLWVTNRKVYGAHKLWLAARKASHDVGRDQVARLMRAMEIRGLTRRRKVFTTRPDPDAVRAPDLVNRNFTADRPDALWVTDLTYVPTRPMAMCASSSTLSRRIVGWRVAANMRTEMVLAHWRWPAAARRPAPGRARDAL